MKFTQDDIKKIAQLSSLAISDDQAKQLTDNFEQILGLVEKMNQSDTQAVEPLAHPFNALQPKRPDTVTETNERERMQSIAPDVKAGLYIVPQFVE